MEIKRENGKGNNGDEPIGDSNGHRVDLFSVVRGSFDLGSL